MDDRTIPLDLICDPATYTVFTQVRYNTGTHRFASNQFNGAFFYDNVLWGRDGGTLHIVERNYVVNSRTEQGVMNAVNQINTFTGGVLPNGVKLSSQTPESSWPDPMATNSGYLIYLVDRDATWVIDAGKRLNPDGRIGAALLAIKPGRGSLGSLAVDTWEVLGFIDGYGPVTSAGQPLPGMYELGKILYNRKYRQTSCEVPDCQS